LLTTVLRYLAEGPQRAAADEPHYYETS